MRIGIIQRSDVRNVRALSGIPFFAARALERHVGEVVCIGPDDSLLTRAIEKAGLALNRISHALLKRRISADHHRGLALRLARVFSKRLHQSGCDVLFAPNASVEIAMLDTRIPIVYYSDLSWADIVDYYPYCTSLFGFAREEAELIEASAMKRAAALIYPSPWAVKTAVEHYHIDPAMVHYIPCGANFDNEDVPSADLALRHPLDDEIRLLWIGVDWDRKRGDIAFDCLRELENWGVNASLVICGCVPPARFRHPRMEVIPFLNKHDAEQRRKLSSLFLHANFFLFPTMAEAYGIVLCEASAHGLPSLVRNTGGVGGAITDGENGYLMSPDAKGADYAAKVIELIRDPDEYERLVRSSRTAYEQRLNWDAWGRSVQPIFAQAVRTQTP